MNISKFSKLLASIVTLSSAFVCSADAAPILVGSSTLNISNDLTVIKDENKTYEFLDLTSTVGKSQATALSQYGNHGFVIGSSVDLTRLFESFGFSFGTVRSSGYRDFVLPVSDMQANQFMTYLGKTYGSSTVASYIDVDYGQSYACISNNDCSPENFAINLDFSQGTVGMGIYMVRVIEDPSDVPEPSSIVLIGLGLASFAAARRRGKLPTSTDR